MMVDLYFQVNIDSMCDVGPSSPKAVYPPMSLVTTMKENQRMNTNLKWQYFGSETGYMTIYPSSTNCNTNFDARFR